MNEPPFPWLLARSLGVHPDKARQTPGAEKMQSASLLPGAGTLVFVPNA
ncbi:MAG: hypothetical protein PVF12_08700 [Thiohalocapsa sp.]